MSITLNTWALQVLLALGALTHWSIRALRALRSLTHSDHSELPSPNTPSTPTSSTALNTQEIFCLEPIFVEFEVSNPLKLNITVQNIQLKCEYLKGDLLSVSLFFSFLRKRFLQKSNVHVARCMTNSLHESSRRGKPRPWLIRERFLRIRGLLFLTSEFLILFFFNTVFGTVFNTVILNTVLNTVFNTVKMIFWEAVPIMFPTTK
jgi:hypothetical protein